MIFISPESMLLVGAMCGFSGFASMFLSICYGILGVLNPPKIDMSKVRVHTEEDWPSSGDV